MPIRLLQEDKPWQEPQKTGKLREGAYCALPGMGAAPQITGWPLNYPRKPAQTRLTAFSKPLVQHPNLLQYNILESGYRAGEKLDAVCGRAHGGQGRPNGPQCSLCRNGAVCGVT